MRRRLFNFGAAVSLLVLVGTVLVWIRSFYRQYGLDYQAPQNLYRLLWVHGDM